MPFCPKGQAICKIPQQIILKWGNSQQEKFKVISKESCVSFKSYTCSMNSAKFIHCFLPEQSKLSLSFTCNSLFKHAGFLPGIFFGGGNLLLC